MRKGHGMSIDIKNVARYLCVSHSCRGVVLGAPLDDFVLVQRRKFLHVHPEDMLLDVVRKRLDLVRRVYMRGHREDLIQFFKRKALGLGDEQENQEEADGVPPCVPPEGTLRLEGAQHTWEGDGDDEVATIGRANQRRIQTQTELTNRLTIPIGQRSQMTFRRHECTTGKLPQSTKASMFISTTVHIADTSKLNSQ